MEVIGGVEAAATVDAFVGDEVGETSEDVPADFAFVYQITFSR